MKIAMIMNSLSVNGISSVVLNYCKNIDQNKYLIDIIAGAPISPMYVDEFSKKGIQIIEMPSRKKRPLLFYSYLFKSLKHGHYDIVHVHGNSTLIFVELMLAYISGIKIRIAHSHNSSCSHLFLHKLFRPIFDSVYTHGFACSEIAGKWLFNEKPFTIIPNGFNVDDYVFSTKNRKRIRSKLGLDNNYVIGHIGRMNYQKNQDYLIQIFEKYCSINENAMLLLVGVGPDYDRIVKRVEQSRYKNNIVLYGESTNTAEVYSSFDVFLFPSRYEGFGIAAVEAQINGLFCVMSDKVPRDVVISNNTTFIPLNEDEKWINALKESYIKSRKDNSFKSRLESFQKNYKEIKNYDIFSNAKKLEKIYEEYYNASKKSR